MAEVRIADTGMGIDAADVPHVFERFYRGDAARARDPAGTGLGLPSARWIANEHGGVIELHCVAGEGTTAIVQLPFSAATAREPRAAQVRSH